MVAASEPPPPGEVPVSFVRVLPGQTSIDDYVEPEPQTLVDVPDADARPTSERPRPAPRRTAPPEATGFLLDL